MAEMGMSMPGAQRSRSPALNVYTGLALIATVCLLTAVILVGRAGMMIGPGGGVMGALQVHPEGQKIELGK